MLKAQSSGISLTAEDAAIVKGMLNRGDRQHDIASWFGVNGGRVADISTGKTFANVQPTAAERLPPQGPYLAGKSGAAAQGIIIDLIADLELITDRLKSRLSEL